MITINRLTFFKFFIPFIILFPAFPAFTRTSGGRLGDIVMVGSAIGLMAIYLLFFKSSLKSRHVFYALIYFSIFILLICISIFIELEYISIRDLFEFHKPIYIILVFFLFSSVSWDTQTIKKYLVNVFRLVFVLSIIYALFEAFGGSLGNKVSTIIYKTDRPILYGKSTGSFGITYFFAVFMIFSSYYFFFKYLFERNKKDLIFYLLSLVCVLASQSRTMLIALLFSYLYVFFIYWSFEGLPHKKTVYIFFFLFIGIVFIIYQPILNWAERTYPYLYLGINALIEKGGVSATGGGSANIRYQQLLWVLENQFSIPLIGVGIGKSTGPQLESFYALYLYRYGIIGILLYVILLVATYLMSLKSYKKAIRDKDYGVAAFFISFSIFCFILPLTSVSSVITDQPRFVILYYGTIGVMVRYLYKNPKHLEELSENSPSY